MILNFCLVHPSDYHLHSAVHANRPDLRCAIYIGCNPVVAVSSLKNGLLPLTNDAAVLGEVIQHAYTGTLAEPDERDKLIRNLGPVSKVLLLSNHGALCCGETIEEAFYAAYHIVQACETQLKLLPVGIENLNLLSEETRKAIYDASRRPPEGYEHTAAVEDNKDGPRQQVRFANFQPSLASVWLNDFFLSCFSITSQPPKWRVGGAEFEALMRMLDNAGFRTGYIYRNPLVKSELPKPKNDVEVPPAVSSLGYLLEEEELYRQGWVFFVNCVTPSIHSRNSAMMVVVFFFLIPSYSVWKRSDLRKGGDRSRWLNSPNVYQKVEVLETGTTDPKKITKVEIIKFENVNKN